MVSYRKLFNTLYMMHRNDFEVFKSLIKYVIFFILFFSPNKLNPIL